MDFSTGEIIDIVHNRWHSTPKLLSIYSHKERLNVKGVLSDAYKTYLTMPEYFPKCGHNPRFVS